MRFAALCVAGLLISNPLQSQTVDSLVIEAPSGRVVLRSADLAGMPRDTIRTTLHDTAHVYSGVALSALLRRVGVHADSLRGRTAVSRRIVVEAADGYRGVFSLAEADPTLSRRVIVADRLAGRPLPANEGPFRIIIGNDERHSRWIRNVAAIRVRDESNGP